MGKRARIAIQDILSDYFLFCFTFPKLAGLFFLFRDGRESMRETEERRGKRKEGTVEEETEKHPWGLEKQ